MRVFERIVVSRIYKAKAIIITLLICSICAKPIRRLLSWDSEAAINNVTAGGKSDLKPISHLASKREWWLGILRSTQLPSWPHPYPQALHLRPTNKLEVGGKVTLKSSVRFLSVIPCIKVRPQLKICTAFWYFFVTNLLGLLTDCVHIWTNDSYSVPMQLWVSGW